MTGHTGALMIIKLSHTCMMYHVCLNIRELLRICNIYRNTVCWISPQHVIRSIISLFQCYTTSLSIKTMGIWSDNQHKWSHNPKGLNYFESHKSGVR